ncbi:MAG: flagellar export chaperone FliS [Syntrophomonadaceae bacterium]|nr:flagellar export chaperone FliS [Syntrophomonadaceae bacterium]
MNMSARVYDQYRRTAIETVSPGKLLIMLYDGAIKNINTAIAAINNKDFNGAHNDIIKTQDIIVELMSTLNMDYDISKNLYSLYDYMMNRLIEANLNKDTAILEEVGGFLRELRDTWDQVVKQQGNTTSRTSAASLSVKG